MYEDARRKVHFGAGPSLRESIPSATYHLPPTSVTVTPSPFPSPRMLSRAVPGLTLSVPTLPQINTRAVERDIFDGDAGLDRSGLWTATEPSRAAKL